METNDWKKFKEIVETAETPILKELLGALRIELKTASHTEGSLKTAHYEALTHRVETQQKFEKVFIELDRREKEK